MSLLPAGFDPFAFLEPFYGGGGGFAYDPYSAYDQQRSTRRRTEQGAAPGEAGGEVAEQGATARRPFTVGSAGWTRSVPVDFIEREKEYVVRADLPGVHRDEIHVEVREENVLRFGHNPRPEREKEDEEEPGIFHRAERVSTFRNRNLRMPEDADLQGEIKAKYEDGVLTITIPKKEPGMKGPGKVIPIS